MPPEVTRYAADWPMAQGDSAAHPAAADSPIVAENGDRLDAAWRFPIEAASGYGAVTVTPIVLGDTICLQDMESNVFAIDRATGALRWRRAYGLPTASGNGIAVGYGLAFGVIGIGAEVFALRADSGDEAWRTTLSANPAEFVFIQPQVHDGVVYVSTSPAAYVPGSRGIRYALAAERGDVLWQWETTTDNLWGAARLNSGGVWYQPSIDEAGNPYFGTGKPGTVAGRRPGAHHTTGSELPFQLDGLARPGDRVDAVACAGRPARPARPRRPAEPDPRDGRDRWQSSTPRHRRRQDRHGDCRRRQHREEVWRASVGDRNAHGDGASLPEPSGTPVTVVPGFFGGVLTPMAFASDTVFAPVIDLPFVYTNTESVFDLAGATGEMVADATNGRLLWSAPVDTFFSGGATVADDVVFGAGRAGIVRGFATADGREVWCYQLGAGIDAPLAVAGDTLFAAAGAFFIGAGEDPPTPRPELVAFRLGGSGTDASATPAAGSVSGSRERVTARRRAVEAHAGSISPMD